MTAGARVYLRSQKCWDIRQKAPDARRMSAALLHGMQANATQQMGLFGRIEQRWGVFRYTLTSSSAVTTARSWSISPLWRICRRWIWTPPSCRNTLNLFLSSLAGARRRPFCAAHFYSPSPCKFSSVKSSWGLDFLFAGYNKDTVKGTAASRVFFRLRAEAVRMREEWPDFVSPRANTPARESVSRLSRSQHSICAGSTASFWRVRVNLRRLNKR